MNIYVDGKPAALKKDFSMEYTAENRLFLGRDGYTLNFSFPLRDCPQNVEIFGRLHRSEVSKRKTSFDCIIAAGEVSLFGRLLVTKITDVEVECQFAEGRCAQVVTDPFEDVYVNELDLGSSGLPTARSTPPAQAWKGAAGGYDGVALPWVNESYPDVPNNWVRKTSEGYAWDEEVLRLSWQPYLITIAERICEQIGYTYDFSEWRNSPMRYLIVCNTLPATWDMPEYARALPAWTVSEFFEKLELFMMCEFDFDHAAKSVCMRFSKTALAAVAPVQLEDVVDTFEAELSHEDGDNCDYIGAKRLAYKECSHEMWPYYSCDWYIDSQTQVMRYATLEALVKANKLRKVPLIGNGPEHWQWGTSFTVGLDEDERLKYDSTVNRLLYAEDVDTYFVFRRIGSGYWGAADAGADNGPVYVLQPVNVFGSGCVESEDVTTEEIEFVPVCIMDTFVSDSDDKGPMMFLNPGSFDADDDGTDNSAEFRQPRAAAAIEAGAKEGLSAFYDAVYLAFWDGTMPNDGPACPVVDSVNVTQSWDIFYKAGFSMRLLGGAAPVNALPQVDPRQKYKFSWLGRNIPDPRAVFYIRGRRYLCEKITATFTENGLSQLLKGEFYPLRDD